MQQTKGNDPANSIHPDVTPNFDEHNYAGLTKREYFAAKAMQGFLNKNLPQDRAINEGGIKRMLNQLAEASVKVADELINALNQTSNTPQQ